ncbi:hypothetical protein A5482_013015 [Cyanobacterium sp. IPPAS B-1200]|uniref:hypothetical protein n=1 Tax=Cyanobacterium sp. IPPAS B-1200 TaxID=1562720 RepID=UPI00085278B0|nr:hypothetical protein [Cyanobacterium sp. IPPAS B-1200]OEJ77604.1 hypothetical protein A5482_04765 [Cyanobacterium sp. IPPAS B-1200]
MLEKFKIIPRGINLVLIAIATTLLIVYQGVAMDHTGYEVWGSDQSNSVAGIETVGTDGGLIWIWDSKDIERQIESGIEAQPLGCDGNNRAGDGPCDVNAVFPPTLAEYNENGVTGQTIADLPGFGRLHGMITDPQNKYLNLNLFAPTGGYVGIMDGETKEAIALFRVTGTNGSPAGRSVHMSFWNDDGSALLVANLNGKLLERIDITRDAQGKITNAIYNKSASLGVGKGMEVTAPATVFLGKNAHNHDLMGEIAGSYQQAAMADLTPNGVCKENGCREDQNPILGGRTNNLIICPIVSSTNHAYITLAGGGLLVANTEQTPMTIVGEYDNQVLNGAGCGGVEVNGKMWLNGGISASDAGATQSTFIVYNIDDTAFGDTANAPNTPYPTLVYKGADNTATNGNTRGEATDGSGQLPGITTRRDSHGMARTVNGRYIHTVDRIQNTIEVFNSQTFDHLSYDLTSEDGKGNGMGACAIASINDDADLPKNDPAPDLMEESPDGKYLYVAFRGLIPVSVAHSSQGSCPGVGVVELQYNGSFGRLVSVLRSSNTEDSASVASIAGGHNYQGLEHSDLHGVTIRRK